MLGFWGWGDKGLGGGNERESYGLLLIEALPKEKTSLSNCLISFVD